ncbi:unnamed protein product [Amoebophrya sp. A120]|nr:unnamed protein product [Amoebophrya sp. A120]|eukprot:GSA120T00023521001.1
MTASFVDIHAAVAPEGASDIRCAQGQESVEELWATVPTLLIDAPRQARADFTTASCSGTIKPLTSTPSSDHDHPRFGLRPSDLLPDGEQREHRINAPRTTERNRNPVDVEEKCVPLQADLALFAAAAAASSTCGQEDDNLARQFQLATAADIGDDAQQLQFSDLFPLDSGTVLPDASTASADVVGSMNPPGCLLEEADSSTSEEESGSESDGDFYDRSQDGTSHAPTITGTNRQNPTRATSRRSLLNTADGIETLRQKITESLEEVGKTRAEISKVFLRYSKGRSSSSSTASTTAATPNTTGTAVVEPTEHAAGISNSEDEDDDLFDLLISEHQQQQQQAVTTPATSAATSATAMQVEGGQQPHVEGKTTRSAATLAAQDNLRKEQKERKLKEAYRALWTTASSGTGSEGNGTTKAAGIAADVYAGNNTNGSNTKRTAFLTEGLRKLCIDAALEEKKSEKNVYEGPTDQIPAAPASTSASITPVPTSTAPLDPGRLVREFERGTVDSTVFENELPPAGDLHHHFKS